jgi:flagellar basal-body rod protein FlgB
MSELVPQFDAIQFGAAAVRLRSLRQELLTGNIVNADTPNYQARDIRFADALQRELRGLTSVAPRVQVVTTHRNHFASNDNVNGPELYYRTPVQPAIDGNTVDPDLERSHFAKNAMMMEATLQFLSGSFKTRLAAVTGQPS